uniref:IS200/IS605 family accessory protein TnpB-related protein n=1 Tax=Hassallia byssoidea TaxID=482630 RepID=UPI00301407DB
MDEFLSLGVTHVSIGKNEQWKTRLNLGKRTNQNFTQIPHAKFIEMLTYKLERVGITVLVAEESYTSKSSAIDWAKSSRLQMWTGFSQGETRSANIKNIRGWLRI